MVDQTLDALMEAVFSLAKIMNEEFRFDMTSSNRVILLDILYKLDALIAMRKGRIDDQPASH